MKKLLIVSGDSFTDRSFRSAAHPEMDTSFPMWPDLLAEKLDMRLINLGRSGQGNEYIYSVLQDTIENIEDKASIGMVVAGWSQCFRSDYQEGAQWYSRKVWKDQLWVEKDIMQVERIGGLRSVSKGWVAERVNPQGDIFSWIRKSLRTYQNLVYLCERYNIPYAQTQMIPLYVDYLRGLPPTDQEIMFGGKTFENDTMVYPGDFEEDQDKIRKIILSYDGILGEGNFIGWPISRSIGGYPLSIEVCGVVGSPYVISEYDGHPNEEGHKRIAEHIYDWLG